MKTVAAVSLVCLVALAGCANSRSVLYSGVSLDGGPKQVITDAAAAQDVRLNRTEWLGMIAGAGGQDWTLHSSQLSAGEFRRRLAAAAARYGFTVKEVEFLHSGRPTPLVVVETSHYLALAHAVPAIARSLDPHRGRNDLRGWTFSAFFLEAIDERGVPFLVVRDAGNGGGQWARSDALYPFLHG